MAWIRVDDSFNEHPKMAKVGAIGWGIWLAGLAYCNRNLTDGFIPYAIAESLGGSWRVRTELEDGRVMVSTISHGSGMSGQDMTTGWVIDLLVSSGLWDEVKDGYLVHDFDQYQPSREQVLRERENTRVRVGKFREKRNVTALQLVRNAVTNGTGNGAVTVAPDPDPDPKRSLAPQAARVGFDLKSIADRYPRRKGIAPGLAKLKAVVKTQADYDAVLAGMERFCAEVRRKGTEIEYLPYFSTWVNARRWEDGDDLPLPSVPSESRRDSEDLGDMAKRLGLE